MSFIPPTFSAHQFAYRAKRLTEDAIAVALPSALSHLVPQGSYARLIFIDFSSAFNTTEDLTLRVNTAKLVKKAQQ